MGSNDPFSPLPFDPKHSAKPIYSLYDWTREWIGERGGGVETVKYLPAVAFEPRYLILDLRVHAEQLSLGSFIIIILLAAVVIAVAGKRATDKTDLLVEGRLERGWSIDQSGSLRPQLLRDVRMVLAPAELPSIEERIRSQLLMRS